MWPVRVPCQAATQGPRIPGIGSLGIRTAVSHRESHGTTRASPRFCDFCPSCLSDAVIQRPQPGDARIWGNGVKRRKWQLICPPSFLSPALWRESFGTRARVTPLPPANQTPEPIPPSVARAARTPPGQSGKNSRAGMKYWPSTCAQLSVLVNRLHAIGSFDWSL